MIPALTSVLNAEIETVQMPSYTYAMELSGNRIRGYTDELEAMKQAIYKIIMTERYKYIIYSWNYGIELADLFGKAISFVCPEIERRITEALLADTRIQSVDNFEFDFPKRGEVVVTFIAHTIFGDVKAERVVNF